MIRRFLSFPRGKEWRSWLLAFSVFVSAFDVDILLMMKRNDQTARMITRKITTKMKT